MVHSVDVSLIGETDNTYTKTAMYEWMFNDIPAWITDRLLGVRKKVNAWNGYIIKNCKVL